MYSLNPKDKLQLDSPKRSAVVRSEASRRGLKKVERCGLDLMWWSERGSWQKQISSNRVKQNR